MELDKSISVVKMDNDNKVKLPKQVCEKLHIKVGDLVKVAVNENKDCIIIEKGEM